ncbi:methionine/alanine import family NSS transporter small subunit [Shouchella patagoniensis]|nr:methionine/alanine import family NSS transporter small subunit [Shouchella patagoniensis]
MSTSAILMMVVGMVILWGGMIASITFAYITSRRKKKENKA